MNKTDRMLAIMLELQRSRRVRAGDLATKFETSVRTIYRDIQALSEGGVPVVSAPGQGYSLPDGYFLPPVSFTAEEAVALLAGADFIRRHFDAYYSDSAAAGCAKLEAVLPERVRADADRIRASMRLVPGGREDERGKAGLEAVRRAVLHKRKLRFLYGGYPAGKEDVRTDRTVHPYGLALLQGAWVLIAYCELREAVRHFRLSRMDGMELLEETFAVPAGFTYTAYTPPDDRELVVKIRLSPAAARQVQEEGYFYIDSAEDAGEELELRLRVRRVEEILRWLLGWGAEARVLEPEFLRERVRQEAKKILERC
ncbi:YafY family transcriptional regulator [Paenibacillus sp. PK3_47]|uniref:helix-turn-helix transcriptional regulator n=1 Tax=Paenibacillus sp. PK3_47 TaxID=2072642 RepID=UPI00201DD7A6|nr:YafY family protein [Paenibacillus sp. PK3_47]UQZ33468.1 YafY family transcriptional regulator [Paenibacillus sp. PK3_47]